VVAVIRWTLARAGALSAWFRWLFVIIVVIGPSALIGRISNLLSASASRRRG
jgi:hypothetical protein